MPKRDYYQILDIPKNATPEQIKKAYRKKALQHHPDKNPGDPTAEEKFKEIGEAYEALSDPQKRAAYDRYGHDAFDPRARGAPTGARGFHNPFDIFREVFGGAAGPSGGSIFDDLFGETRRDPTAPQRGEDLRYDLEITFEEAALGCQKQIPITKPHHCQTCNGTGAAPGAKTRTCPTCNGTGQTITTRGIFSIAQTCHTCQGQGKTIEKPCPKCHGQGRTQHTQKITIKIPPGVDTNTRIRSKNNGAAGPRGGPNGDLYIILHVKQHEIFQRDDQDNLQCEIPISLIQATLGDEIQVPTLKGKTTLKIPPGTQPGTTFRIKNQGIKNLQGYGNGDLHIRVNVEIPTRLNHKQTQKLKEFAQLCDHHVNPISTTFLEKARKFFTR